MSLLVHPNRLFLVFVGAVLPILLGGWLVRAGTVGIAWRPIAILAFAVLALGLAFYLRQSAAVKRLGSTTWTKSVFDSIRPSLASRLDAFFNARRGPAAHLVGEGGFVRVSGALFRRPDTTKCLPDPRTLREVGSYEVDAQITTVHCGIFMTTRKVESAKLALLGEAPDGSAVVELRQTSGLPFWLTFDSLAHAQAALQHLSAS